jgi:hypothetical protein
MAYAGWDDATARDDWSDEDRENYAHGQCQFCGEPMNEDDECSDPECRAWQARRTKASNNGEGKSWPF